MYLVNAALGTAIAISQREPADFAGVLVRWKLAGADIPTDFLRGTGTALSAPLPMLLAFAGAVRLSRRPTAMGRRALRAVVLMCAGFVAGQAGEPVTWRTLRDPRSDVPRTAVIVANMAVPLVAGLGALRELRSR